MNLMQKIKALEVAARSYGQASALAVDLEQRGVKKDSIQFKAAIEELEYRRKQLKEAQKEVYGE